MKYLHIKNNSNKLLVFFNDMSYVGVTNNKFLAFRAVRILNAVFNDKKIFIALLIKEFLNSK